MTSDVPQFGLILIDSLVNRFIPFPFGFGARDWFVLISLRRRSLSIARDGNMVGDIFDERTRLPVKMEAVGSNRQRREQKIDPVPHGMIHVRLHLTRTPGTVG